MVAGGGGGSGAVVQVGARPRERQRGCSQEARQSSKHIGPQALASSK